MAVNRIPGTLRPEPFSWLSRPEAHPDFDQRRSAQGHLGSRLVSGFAKYSAPPPATAAPVASGGAGAASAAAASYAAPTESPAAAPSTRRAVSLLAEIKPRTPLAVRVLRPGDRGDEVRVVQSLLNRHQLGVVSVFPTAIDSIYWGSTELAVTMFQERERMLVTGHVDSRTYLRLLTARPFGAERVAAETGHARVLQVGGATEISNWFLAERLGALFDALSASVDASLDAYVTRDRFIEETQSWATVFVFQLARARPLHARIARLVDAASVPAQLAQFILDALEIAARACHVEHLDAAGAQLREVVSVMGPSVFAELIDARIESAGAAGPGAAAS